MVKFNDAPMQIQGNSIFEARVQGRAKAKLEEEFFARVVQAALQCGRQDLSLTPGNIVGQDPDLPVRLVHDILQTSKMQLTLRLRGLDVSGENGLSARQLNALQVYLNTELPLTHTQRLKAAGVRVQEWDAWMRQPAFEREMNVLAEERVKAAQPRALQGLVDSVDRGEKWGIEMLLEITKRHDRRAPTVDVDALLRRLFGLLDEELAKLPGGDEALERIGSSMRGMLQAQSAPVMQIMPSRPPVRQDLSADLMDEHTEQQEPQ